jgi:hypothetical protein
MNTAKSPVIRNQTEFKNWYEEVGGQPMCGDSKGEPEKYPCIAIMFYGTIHTDNGRTEMVQFMDYAYQFDFEYDKMFPRKA